MQQMCLCTVCVCAWCVPMSHALSVPAEPSLHTLSEVLFCQPDTPSLGLSVAFDSEQLFSFDVPNSQWLPQLPDGPSWPADIEQPHELLHDAALCRELLDLLTRIATGPNPMPEAKGGCCCPRYDPADGSPAVCSQ